MEEKLVDLKDLLFWQIIIIVACFWLVGVYYSWSGEVSTYHQNLDQAPWAPPVWLEALLTIFTNTITAITTYIGCIDEGATPKSTGIFLMFVSIGLFLNILFWHIFYGTEHLIGGLVIIILRDLVVTAKIIYLFWLGSKGSRPARIAGGLLVINLIFDLYITSGLIYSLVKAVQKGNVGHTAGK